MSMPSATASPPAAIPGAARSASSAIPTVAPYLLPPILRDFSKRFPFASVALHEDLTAHVERACVEGELDLGITASPPAHEMLDGEPLFTEELIGRPAAASVDPAPQRLVANLADEPFIVLADVHCLGEQVLSFCRQQGCVPCIRCQSTQLLTVQELVALGHGVSLIPTMASRQDRGRRCKSSFARRSPPQTHHHRESWRRRPAQPPLVKEFLALFAAKPPTTASPRTNPDQPRLFHTTGVACRRRFYCRGLLAASAATFRSNHFIFRHVCGDFRAVPFEGRRKEAHMLRFAVDHPLPDPTTNRFVALVNRLLPNGWRFSISPMPRVVDVEDPLGLGPYRRPILMPIAELADETDQSARRRRLRRFH